jgi:hypothetical protein
VNGTPKTIVDVMRDVFGMLFPMPSWRPWVLCAAAVFALHYGLTAEDERFILDCLKRSSLPKQPAKRVVLIIGRRGGKSRFAAFLAVFLACFKDYASVLTPGERGIGMVLAPDRRQARVCFRYIEAFLDHVPMLAAMVESRTKEAIHLTNAVSIEVHTSSFRAVRGYSIVFAIVDEVAFLPQEDSSEPDQELIRALLPAMATTAGMLILISSPHAKRGVLWHAMQRYYGRDDAETLVWKAGTAAMNPRIDADVIASAREEDPTAAASEWDAEFRADLETFLTREAVDGAVVSGRLVLAPRTGVQYSAFVDPAGGTLGGDDFTGAIVHREGEQVVLDAIFAQRAPFSPEDTTKDLSTWLKQYHVSAVRGDRYAGEWPAEQFRKHGITYRAAEKPKSELYREFGAVLNSGQVDLLDDARLVTQLTGLERRTARGGKDSIDHPPGSHDDIANAVAGAVAHATTLQAPVPVGVAHVHWL